MGMIYSPPSIIPNGALINDVCHIYQSSKPTTRPDGSALVIGDKWYNIATGVEGFWNGTYWVSSTKFIHSGTYFTNRSTTSTTYVEFYGSEIRATIPLGKILITQCGFNLATNGSHDASNNYTFLLAAIVTWADAENGIALDTFNSWHDTTRITTNNTRRHRQTNLALYLDTETPGPMYASASGLCTIAMKFRVNTGVPGSIYGTPYITYREVL